MPMIRIIDDFELNIKFLLVGFGYAYVDLGVFFFGSNHMLPIVCQSNARFSPTHCERVTLKVPLMCDNVITLKG